MIVIKAPNCRRAGIPFISSLLPVLLCFHILLFSSNFAAAFSAARENPISHLSPVLDIKINTENSTVTPDSSFSITLEIPASSVYSNIQRRWVAIADPNSRSKYRKLASYFPFIKQQLLFHDDNQLETSSNTNSNSINSGNKNIKNNNHIYNDEPSYDSYAHESRPHHHNNNKLSFSQFTWADGSPVAKDAYYSASLNSEKLLHYLTKNNTDSSLEYPTDSQIFKITLQPNTELADTSKNVYTLDKQGNMVPHPDFANDGKDNRVKIYKGIAYRQVSTINPATGYLMSSFKQVGWARFLVSKDGDSPIVDGTWKVDDEEGLGVPAAIYHINSKSIFKTISRASPPEIHEAEMELLDQLEQKYSHDGSVNQDLVVWRDADMFPTMYQNLDIFKDDYDQSSLDQIKSFIKLKTRGLNSIFSKRTPKNGNNEDNEEEEDLDKLIERDPDYLFKYQVEITQGGYLRKRQNDTAGDSGFSSGMNLASTIGNTNGCPNRRMIALIGIAGDCSLVGSFNTSSAAREYIINMVNSASQVYERQFNITLGVSALVLVGDSNCPNGPGSDSGAPWNYRCETNAANAMSDRLSEFSKWRTQGSRANDGIAAWTLLTACTQSSVVGLSWMGLLCSSGTADSEGSSVAGTNVVARTNVGWRVYAHELGHTFGAVHDCTSDTCSQNLQASSQCCPQSQNSCDAGGAYIMSPASSSNQDMFSQCTVGNICAALGRNSVNSTCLTSNTGVKLVTSNECGNGIVEEGEECDCGGEEGCAGNNCCDPNTCKFKDGAQCDDSNEECCNNCRFSGNDVTCRASTGPCDYDIKCPGDSSVCPPPRFKENGESCSLPDSSHSGLTCISGHCTSRDLQCVTLMGNTTLTLNGNIVNVTRGCSDDFSCRLSCVDPKFGDMCIYTSQNFLDGTPCRGNGRCRMGRCIGGSGGGFFSDPGSWVDRNKGTLIAIIVSIGAFIVIMIVGSCVRKALWRRRMQKAGNTAPKPQGPFNVPPAYPAAGVYAQQRAAHPPPPPPPPAAASSSPWGRNYSNYNYGGNSNQGYYNNDNSGYDNYSSYNNSSYNNSSYNNNSYNNNNRQPESYEFTTFATHNVFDDSNNDIRSHYPPPPPPPPRYQH